MLTHLATALSSIFFIIYIYMLYNCGKQHCVSLFICFPYISVYCNRAAKAEKQWENITANWKWLHIESSIERVFSGNSLGPDRAGGSSCTTVSTHTIKPLSEIGEFFFFFCRSCSFERVLGLFALMMDRMREKFVLALMFKRNCVNCE